jgi:hypothetical protein
MLWQGHPPQRWASNLLKFTMPQCAFCLREAKLTGEHIWSDWICELFPDIRVIFRKQFAHDGMIKEWEGSMDCTTNVVCKQCNEGWMSDLESNHAKPSMQAMILGDSPITLDTRRMVSIAIFAFKSAVIGDLMQPKRPLYFSSLARRRFSHTLSIPTGCQVWVGCIGEPDPHHGVCRMRYWCTAPGAPNGYHIYAFTWGVGRFIFQLTATRWKRGRLRRQIIPHLTQNPYWDYFSIPIWSGTGVPVSTIVKWPPSRHLSHNVLDDFTNRWEKMTGPNFSRF